MVAFLGNAASVVSVGDSAGYILEGDVPRLVVPRDRRDGMLTDCLGDVAPRGHVRLVGLDQALLLCTDGVADVVPPDELARVLAASPGRWDRSLRRLMDAVEKAGAPDNATAVLIAKR